MQVFGSISLETSDNAVPLEPCVFSEDRSLRVYLRVKKVPLRCYFTRTLPVFTQTLATRCSSLVMCLKLGRKVTSQVTTPSQRGKEKKKTIPNDATSESDQRLKALGWNLHAVRFLSSSPRPYPLISVPCKVSLLCAPRSLKERRALKGRSLAPSQSELEVFFTRISSGG